MLYKTYVKGIYQVIKFDEVLTLFSNIEELESIVNDLLKKNIVNIAIHLKEGSLLYSATAVVLVYCYKAISCQNGRLVLINVNQDIRDYLSIIDFDRTLKTYDSEVELTFDEQES